MPSLLFELGAFFLQISTASQKLRTSPRGLQTMLIVFKGLYFEEAQRCPKTLLASDLQKHQYR
jgi:hypothetical protein